MSERSVEPHTHLADNVSLLPLREEDAFARARLRGEKDV